MEVSELAGEGADETGSSMVFDEVSFGRRKTAIHEAGHLAIAHALDGFLCGGDIRPDGRFGGQAIYRLGGDGPASVDRITTILAGPAAQRRIAPRDDDGGERDRERVAQHLDVLCRDPSAATVVRRHCQREAERLIAIHWDLIEAFAEALLTHEALTGDELREIVSDVEHRPKRERWRAIQARADSQTPEIEEES